VKQLVMSNFVLLSIKWTR